MTILEIVLIIVGVLNVLFMSFMVSLIKDVVSLKLLMTQLHTAVAALASRTINQELMISKLGNSFADFVNMASNMIDRIDMVAGSGRIYKTADGKFSGTSIQDLIEKIKQAGEENEYISKEDIDKDMDRLRKMFEQQDDIDDEEPEDYDTQR